MQHNMRRQTNFIKALKKKKIILLRARLWYLYRIQNIIWEKENIIRDFNQKLYIFLLKLKLYLSDRALNYVSLHYDHIINLVNVVDITSYSL